MFDWVNRVKLSEETGLNFRQIEKRRQKIWEYGVHFKKFEDGEIWYNVKAIRKWQTLQANKAA